MLTNLWVSSQVARNCHETRKERESGKVQKHCCTRLLVLPPIEVARFRQDVQLGGEPPSETAEAGAYSKRARQEGGRVMVTEQAKQMAEFFASLAARTSKPDLDLATMRDINEGVHVCGTEPEGVTYAEVDAGGVPALWCVPKGSDPERVLLHSHNGGDCGLKTDYHHSPAADRCAPARGTALA